MSEPLAPLHSLNPGKAAGGGRPCMICRLPLKVRQAVEERLMRGDKATEIFRWLTKTFPAEAARVKYDAVARHGRIHLPQLNRAAQKLSDGERMQREKLKLARDVLADKAIDPQAYFGPAAIAQDIQKTSVRLDLAAEDAFVDGEHASLASLSGQLLRSAELRAKMGGSIQDRTEVNLSVTLGELHARLDGILGADQAERQHAARTLLGIAAPGPDLASAVPTLTPDPVPAHTHTHARSLDAQADPSTGSGRQPRDVDPTNPLGEPLTIDADPAPSKGPFEEPLGTRHRP